MSYEQVVTLAVLAVALALFVTEKIPLGVTGLLAVAALGLSGVLDAKQAVGAFSSPVVVLVGSLYVVSASLIRTGVVATLDRQFLRIGTTGSERRLLVWATLAALLVSTVLNNTSVVVILLPVLLAAAQRVGVPPSRLLMPISFAAILGGTMTLIGTSTNILVADLADEIFEIGFFDFLPVGAGFAFVGLLYLWFLGPKLLPSRPTVSSVTQGRAFEYLSELRVPAAGPAAGLAPSDLARRAGPQVRVLQIVRGEEVLDRFAPDMLLAPGDIVVLRAPSEAIVSLCQNFGLETLPQSPSGVPVPSATTFAEIVITPGSELVGQTLADVALNRTFGVVAVALQRRGAHLRFGIVFVPLRVGDVVLVQGSPERIERLRGQGGFLLLVGVEEKVALRRRAPVAIGILLAFIALATLGVADLPLLAVAACAVCLFTGCLTLRRAVREIDFNVLGLLAGAVTLGLALQESHLAERVARIVVDATSGLGHWATLSAVYLLTSIATEAVSNSGAAALMVPIALETARAAKCAPQPFVFAIAYAASASFATPIGYQTNTFVYGPGGYRFRDFLKVGLPLQVLLWVFASAVLPVFFPF